MTLILSGTNGLSDVDGDASTPAVRGTDANSGIFFGADQVGVATNGVERVEFGNSETVFNDGGADVDFRVESDTVENALFVDGATGNIGIGCVPSSIQSGFDTLQIGGNLTLNVDDTGAGAGVYMGNNVYRDSGDSRWEYIYTDEASQYLQASGEHIWRYAGSGSANTAITWSEAMRIDSSGNLVVNGRITYPTELSQNINIVASYSYNDNSVNTIGSNFNVSYQIIYIVTTAVGITAIPIYNNAGAGVGYRWSFLDPDAGTWTYSTGINLTFASAGSPTNTYNILVSGDTATGTIERTSGSTAYQVFVQRLGG